MSKSLLDIKSILLDKLGNELPGSIAHQLLMPNRKAIPELSEVLKKARKSAVLILIYPRMDQNHIVFIQRHTYNGSHSNQIGLPGGKVEQEDHSFQYAALREAHEELKIESANIEILGKLSPLYIPPSNFIVHPFVAIQSSEPTFIPDEYEVKEILEIPLESFLKQDALINKRISIGESQFMDVKGYPYKERIIWGATGMIMTELRALLVGL